eukprot:Nk52_evm63s239 gene=Nk52_evmTU63s239
MAIAAGGSGSSGSGKSKVRGGSNVARKGRAGSSSSGDVDFSKENLVLAAERGGDVDYGKTACQLNNMGLSKLENFDKIPNLKRLSANYNKIIRISGLLNLEHLSFLELKNNSIFKISGLESLTSLEYLDLSGNSISLIDGLQSNTKLKHLDLSFNGITGLGNLKFLTNLESLLLSGNFISNLDLSQRYLPDSLKNFAVDANEITDLNHVQYLSFIRGMVSLSIKDNPATKLSNVIGGSCYRYYVIFHLPSLQFIDGLAVTESERKTAFSLFSRKEDYFTIGMQKELLDYLEDANEKLRMGSGDGKVFLKQLKAKYGAGDGDGVGGGSLNRSVAVSYDRKASSPVAGASLGSLKLSQFAHSSSPKRSTFSYSRHSSDAEFVDYSGIDYEDEDDSAQLLKSTSDFIPVTEDVSSGEQVKGKGTKIRCTASEEDFMSSSADFNHSYVQSCVKIQAYIRGHLTRQRCLRELLKERAAVIIQATWKGFYARNFDRQVRSVREEMRFSRIESYVSSLVSQLELCRKELREEKLSRQAQNDAIRYLWQEVRQLNYKTDQKDSDLRLKAALKIQSVWRSYQSRKKLNA